MHVTRRAFLTISASLGSALAFLRSAHAQAESSPDRNMQRANELLAKMTLEEKAMQVSCVVPLALLDKDGLMRGQAG
jgi:hypothetical protein